jgi:8-oxo-dGTP pyrophosphatase MutT (NUDIX family)
MADYNKIGLLAARDGRILLCRKKHTTSLLILPGGCLEPGESAMDCLHRELREELGEQVSVTDLQYLGTYSDRAAGSDYKIVEIALYRGELQGEPTPQAEIKELVWFGLEDDRSQLSPSIVNKILPDLSSRGLLPWQPLIDAG